METPKLNNAQRSMLDKIYVEKFRGLTRNLQDQRRSEKDALTKTIVDGLLSTNVAKDFKASIDAYNKNLLKFQKAIAKTTALFPYNGPRVLPSEYLNLNLDNSVGTDMYKFNEETKKKHRELDDVLVTVRTKIYGVNSSYKELEKEIEALIKNIIK